MAASLIVRVRTFNLKTNKLDNERVVDMNRPDTQEWFGKHNIWAWLNGMGVQTCNNDDWVEDEGEPADLI